MSKKHNKHSPPQQRPQQAAAQRPPAPPVTPSAPASAAGPAESDAKTTSNTREQRFLKGIHEALAELKNRNARRPSGGTLNDVPPKTLEPRAERLPMMFQRHGPAQTLLFLESKGTDEDSALLYIVTRALTAAEPTLARRLVTLSGATPQETMGLDLSKRLDLSQRLHLSRACVELANLVMRSVKVLVRRDEDAMAKTAGGAQ